MLNFLEVLNFSTLLITLLLPCRKDNGLRKDDVALLTNQKYSSEPFDFDGHIIYSINLFSKRKMTRKSLKLANIAFTFYLYQMRMARSHISPLSHCFMTQKFIHLNLTVTSPKNTNSTNKSLPSTRWWWSSRLPQCFASTYHASRLILFTLPTSFRASIFSLIFITRFFIYFYKVAVLRFINYYRNIKVAKVRALIAAITTALQTLCVAAHLRTRWVHYLPQHLATEPPPSTPTKLAQVSLCNIQQLVHTLPQHPLAWFTLFSSQVVIFLQQTLTWFNFVHLTLVLLSMPITKPLTRFETYTQPGGTASEAYAVVTFH